MTAMQVLLLRIQQAGRGKRQMSQEEANRLREALRHYYAMEHTPENRSGGAGRHRCRVRLMLTEVAVNARRLGLAVVALAVNEARYVGNDPHSVRLRRHARRWITEGGEAFRWWCDVAGVDPVALR